VGISRLLKGTPRAVPDTAVGSHHCSPRANAREDTVHLEDEAISVKDHEGRRRKEEGS
jgi:hypothetical protein